MLGTTLMDLGHGFGVALQPGNLMWCFIGVTIGNIVGVLPGMGVMSAVSILLPLTFGMPAVAAILMLAGIFYGAQYGGAICSILLNLPTHAPHAVTCLDGYPMTLQGRAGTALGITMIAAVVGAAFGITEMVLFAPAVANMALKFGAADMCALMLLGLLTGSTLARHSPLKGVAMTLLGLLLGVVGTDVSSGVTRFDFGRVELQDGVELVALSLGLFGVAEFLKTINHKATVVAPVIRLRMRDMLPPRSDIRAAAFPIMRGTLIGALCSLMPGTGPTIASFVSYSAEKRLSRTPGRFGHGAIEGIAAPEASTHSAVQADFIPTMSLGIPGDSVMALLLGALMIQGISPGPLLVVEHPDIFWGLIASFWMGNLMLVVLNVPLIGIWVKLLRVPHRYLFPAALFFTYIGVFAARTTMFDVGTVMVFGVAGYGLFRLGFEPAPILLGFVLGPRLEENFRRAMQLSGGDLGTFIHSPLSAAILGLCAVLLLAQLVLGARRSRMSRTGPQPMFYEPDKNDHGLPYNPFKACVVPRAIGWITTLDQRGRVNLAPFSQFTNIGYDPPYVMFSGGGDNRGIGRKDSTTNAIEGGEFVCNMATWDLREEVNLTSQAVDPGVDEAALAGLAMLPSRIVRPPRVARSPVHLECVFHQCVTLPGNTVRTVMSVVIGRVVGVHIDDDALTADGRIDVARVRPLCRLGYMDYAVIDRVFEMAITGPKAHKNNEQLMGTAGGKIGFAAT